ncbi:MAG: hypothetical protein HY716_00455 [Planctomycetes bacterium]|nr:hypothetical protein [Planctomycetota bacterium]
MDQIEVKIAELEARVSEDYVEIGRALSALDRNAWRNDTLLKYLHNVDALRASAEGFQADIRTIHSTLERRERLETERRKIEHRVAEAERERRKTFAELAAASYALYKSLPQREKYRTFFEPAAREEAEQARLEADLQSLSAPDVPKGLFRRLRTLSRKLVLRGGLRRSRARRARAFEEIGTRLVETDFATYATGDLKLLFDADQDRRRTLDALRQDIDRNRKEATEVEELLRRHGVGTDVRVRLADLEKRITDVKRQLEVVYGWAGQLFVEHDLRAEAANDALSARVENVLALRRQIADKRAQVHRDKAAQEIESLEKREETLRRKRVKLDEELKIKEREIAEIEGEIRLGQRRIDELRRVVAGEAPYTKIPPAPPDFYPPRQNKA